MLDLRRLQMLHRFSVCGSISAAAASLGYSPSAISQQLSALEHETGAVLLERTARSASLTDAGRLLAERAAAILAVAESAESDLAAQTGEVAGPLVVSTVPSLATLVAAALVGVQRPHPELDLVMRQIAAEQAPVAVGDHLSDLAVVDDWTSAPDDPPVGLTRRRLATEPVVLAVPAGHALTDRTRPLGGPDLARAVSEMIWLCAPPGHASRTAGDQRLADIGAVPGRLWEFEGLDTIADLVADGTGGAFLPASVARAHDHRPGRLVSIPLTPRFVRQVYAITRTSTVSRPAVVLCRTAIAEHLRATLGGPNHRAGSA
jgi:DNA-binding transcriptional LysR family regulator